MIKIAWCFIQKIGRAIFSNSKPNNKPGNSPFCKQVIQDNKDAHERLEKYIGAVEERSTKADEKIDRGLGSLKDDMNKGLDRIYTLIDR